MKRSVKTRRKPDNQGFALVITLSLMVLLTVLSIGLLSLSTISLRAASQSDAMNMARANARLGLMIALGELQTNLGPDRRVSAPAEAVIKDAGQPHLTGAWDSWSWAPAANQSPDYSEKSSKFRRWLISTSNETDAESIGFPGSPVPLGTNTVSLVGDREHSRNISTEVNAAKVNITHGKHRGKFAWAVFDDSVKAPIHLGDPATALSNVVEAASRTAPHRVRADIVSTTLTGLAEPENMISLDTGVIPSGQGTAEEMRSHFHDFTTSTVGLLTDTANGGLKTDLTSLFEDSNASLPATTVYFSTATGAPRWSYLRDHYQKYKNLSGGSTQPTYAPNDTDLTINASGINNSPTTERLLPVIAKCQIVFSLVSHHAHFPGRVKFHNDHGTPTKSNTAFAVPHLVYEPIFTIHNPYDVALKLDRLRIRVWDPPVKFRFEKINNNPRPGETGGSTPFRNDNGAYHSLGSFQAAKDGDVNARKAFTFLLTDGTEAAAGNSLTLLPGEVKVFSARVENTWNWALETANNRRSFFDYEYADNFGNVDRRTTNNYGVEAVPGWDTRAGLQTDHLSHGPRPLGTFYDFERPPRPPGEFWNGYVSMRLDDEVRVQAKPEVVGNNPFKIDILAGKNVGSVTADVGSTNVSSDLLRSFSFTFSNVIQEISKDPSNSVIERTFLIRDILQEPNSTGPQNSMGWKQPFAMLEVSARTTKDEFTDNKPWLYNNHIVEGGVQNHSTVGPSNQSYDIRFREMQNSFNSFPDGIEIDPDNNRGYFGASSSQSDGGSSIVTMARVPVAPMASLGDLIASNLVAGSNLPRVVHPFGNSRAHPLILPNRINRSLGGTMLDHTYLLNHALWDSYYFSSVADYQEGILAGSGDSRDRDSVLNGILSGEKPALNSRLIPVAPVGDPLAAAQEINGLSAEDRSKQLAKSIGVSGPFNLNSTSVEAWRAVLSSLRDREVSGWANQTHDSSDRTPFPRATLPVAGAAEGMSNPGSVVGGYVRWAGYRALDDDQIENLAENIVEQITRRGEEDSAPPLSLGEFVNRRLGGSGDLHSQVGLLQAAIDESGVNATNQSQDSRSISAASVNSIRKRGVINTEAMDGYTGEGAPSSLTQGDLLAALAPIATVRGDTFKIRSYGEALAADGTTILASVWCEAVVQRIPDFVDASDEPETPEASLNQTNETFGRRFEVVSFRWLAKDEI